MNVEPHRDGSPNDLERRVCDLEEQLRALRTSQSARPASRSARALRLGALAVLITLPLAAWAATISVPHTFSNGTTADANEVNANFAALVDESNDQDLRLGDLEAVPFVSDWVPVGVGSAPVITHDLGTLPTRITVQVANAVPSPGTEPSVIHLGGDTWQNATGEGRRGVIVTDITQTLLTVRVGTSSFCPVYDTFATGGARRCLATGAVRVLAWD